MLLDGPLGHPDATRDTGIGASLGHQRQHLLLASTQHGQWIVTSTCRHQFLDQTGVDDRAAVGNSPQVVNELGDLGDPTLEQVADALSAGQKLRRVLDLDVC